MVLMRYVADPPHESLRLAHFDKAILCPYIALSGCSSEGAPLTCDVIVLIVRHDAAVPPSANSWHVQLQQFLSKISDLLCSMPAVTGLHNLCLHNRVI